MYSFFKAIHFIALYMLVGGPAFWFLVWRPIASAHALVREVGSETLWNRVRWGTWTGAILFVGSGLADALRAAAQIFPLSELDLVWMFLTSSRYGQVSLLKVVVAPVFAYVALHGPFPIEPGGGDIARVGDITRANILARASQIFWLLRNLLLLVLGVGILLTISIASHAAALPGIGPLIADLVHLVAAVVWGGGLIYFSAFPWKLLDHSNVHLKQYGRMIRRPSSPVIALAKRFSIIALLAVAAVALTGVINSYFHVYAPEAMVTTVYGRTLLVKLVLFFLVIGAAGINLMYFIPRLSDSDGTRGRSHSEDSQGELPEDGLPSNGRAPDNPTQLLRAFFTTVRIEAFLIVSLLVVTSHLTTLPPAVAIERGQIQYMEHCAGCRQDPGG